MPQPLNFRSAFNGFNREDVVHYIEYLNTNHENQIRQLQADLASLQRESFMAAPDEDLEEQIQEMKEQFEQQEAVLTALNTEKDELLAKCAQMEAVLSAMATENKSLSDQVAQLETQLADAEKSAANAKPTMSFFVEEELAAYRRAERVERVATERANTIYRNLQGALQDTSNQTDQAVANLDNIANQVSTQFSALRDALSDSKFRLDQSLSSLKDLCSDPLDE